MRGERYHVLMEESFEKKIGLDTDEVGEGFVIGRCQAEVGCVLRTQKGEDDPPNVNAFGLEG